MCRQSDISYPAHMSKELIDKYTREKAHIAPKNFKELYKHSHLKKMSYGGGLMDVKQLGKKSCTQRPNQPMNSALKCKMGVECQATCLRDYLFPNNKTTLYIVCVEGEWTVKDGEWDEIPSCERKLFKIINKNTYVHIQFN